MHSGIRYPPSSLKSHFLAVPYTTAVCHCTYNEHALQKVICPYVTCINRCTDIDRSDIFNINRFRFQRVYNLDTGFCNIYAPNFWSLVCVFEIIVCTTRMYVTPHYNHCHISSFSSLDHCGVNCYSHKAIKINMVLSYS